MYFPNLHALKGGIRRSKNINLFRLSLSAYSKKHLLKIYYIIGIVTNANKARIKNVELYANHMQKMSLTTDL